ncbi:hypothetical protein PB1_05125 [Bacillus methanolicus PB1]|uniref:Uncharacterized protein n=1 Tax=Bacillus methanolicus PB1 TaxID=997296 RepID=I3E714_BACMT|nr:hypothetical protein [Bacillus methanolicus]EIJ82285.1 hypothetical protein PB1_05125 [Bacillus methanolicus PB1]
MNFNFNFNEKNFIERAAKLGIKVKFNSDTPGMFFVSGNEKKAVTFERLFPEVFNESLENEESFSLPGLTVDVQPKESHVKIIKSTNVYIANSQIIGAA